LAGSRTADSSITLAFLLEPRAAGLYLDLAKTKAPIAVETLKRHRRSL